MHRKMHHAGKSMAKRLARPTKVFDESAKKPGPDDEPGKMRGGPRNPGVRKRLAGKRI